MYSNFHHFHVIVIEKKNYCFFPDVNLCKKRWRSLRDGFIKNHRQIKSCPSGSAGGKKKEWVYYKLLQFLIPHIEFKETAGNYSQAEDIGDATEDAAIASTSTEQEDLPLQFTEETFNVTREDTPIEANNTHLRQETATTVSKRRGVKRRVTASESTEDKLLNILSKESDDNELFLMSLLPTLKRLRPRQNIQARIKIQQLLQDIEFDSNFSASSPRNDNIEYTYL